MVSSALDLNATSQAKHHLWVPQQDQSRGVGEKEVLRKEEQEEVDEGGGRERKIEAGEDISSLGIKGPWLCHLPTLAFHFPSQFYRLAQGPELFASLNRIC